MIQLLRNRAIKKLIKLVLNIRVVRYCLLITTSYYGRPVEGATFDFVANREKGLRIDLEEAVTPAEVKLLEYFVRAVESNGMQVAEIGTWKGKSASVMGRIVKENNGFVYCIDHWQGNKGTWNELIVDYYDVYCIFRNNMISLGLWGTIVPIVTDSHTASHIFRDESLDLLFIDGCHKYETVKSDLEDWCPKVKRGSIICGHDYLQAEVKMACDAYNVSVSDNMWWFSKR